MAVLGTTEVPNKYLATILSAAAKYGVPPALLAAQINQESSFNPNAVSPDGALGISQFLPSTAAAEGVNPRDVASSINGQAKLMARYKKQFGTWEKALLAYHGGPGAVPDPGPAGTSYARRILIAAGSAINDIPNPMETVDDIADAKDAAVQGLQTLQSGAFWQRMGYYALGVVLVLVGLYIVFRKPSGGTSQTLVKGVDRVVNQN